MQERPLIETAAEQMLAAGMTPHQGATAIEKAMIVEALREHQGNVCRTARALRMHRNTLSRKLVEFGIGDVVKQCRDDLRNQTALRFGGHLPARRNQQRADERAPANRSRVA